MKYIKLFEESYADAGAIRKRIVSLIDWDVINRIELLMTDYEDMGKYKINYGVERLWTNYTPKLYMRYSLEAIMSYDKREDLIYFMSVLSTDESVNSKCNGIITDVFDKLSSKFKIKSIYENGRGYKSFHLV